MLCNPTTIQLHNIIIFKYFNIQYILKRIVLLCLIMGKVEELVKLIDSSHHEWKNLSIRKLRDISGYKKWVCEAYFKLYPKDINRTLKTNNTITPVDVIERGGNGSPSRTKLFESIDDDMIEEIILERANSGEPLSDNFIKTCIVFYKDIRGKDDKIKDNIDMEDFLNIGTSLKNSS